MAFEGDCSEDTRVFCLTSAPNAEAPDSFVPCFLSSYFPEQQGSLPASPGAPKKQAKGPQHETASEGTGSIEAIKASSLSRVDWSKAYSAVSPSEATSKIPIACTFYCNPFTLRFCCCCFPPLAFSRGFLGDYGRYTYALVPLVGP